MDAPGRQSDPATAADQNPAAWPSRRESLGRMVNHSTILLMISIGFLILILAFLILFHENANATNGYRLRGLERERAVLLLEQEVLNMQVAQFQALQNLNSDLQVTTMIPARNIRYVKLADLQPPPKSVSSAASKASAGSVGSVASVSSLRSSAVGSAASFRSSFGAPSKN